MLDSKEYMRIKNSIMILREIAPCYPVLSIIGNKLFSIVQNLAAKETRDDLKLMANAYLGVLKKQQDSDLWIAVALFHKHKTATSTDSGRSAPRDAPTSPTVNGSQGTIQQAKAEAARPAQPSSNYRESDDRGYVYVLDAMVTFNMVRVYIFPLVTYDPFTLLETIRYSRSSTTNNLGKDRVNTVRDSRVGGTVSPGGGGRRNIPLPPKPAVPAYDSRSDQSQASLNRETRDPPVRERESSAATSQPRVDAVPELLVISLKSTPTTHAQENKDGAKDQPRESIRDDGKETAPRDSTKESVRESSKDQGNRDQARNSPRDVGRDYNDNNVQRDGGGRDRIRDLAEGTDREPRGDVKGSSAMPPLDVRDRRDGRDIAASRKELRDSAPRDPRDRDARDGRDARDARPLPASTRDLRELREGGDAREGRNGREPRESRDARDARDIRDLREARDARDPRDVREVRDGRDARDTRVLQAPKDPRETPRDEARESKDARDGGPRPSIPRQQSSETSRVHPSRAAMLQLDTGSPSEPSNDVDRQKERERYRDDDKKTAAGRETERGRDRDIVENQDRGMLREGAKDRRPQGRERVREAIKEALALENPSMTSGRDRQRGDGGGRDQERRGADRRDEVTGTNRTKVSPSRRGEDRPREGREREGRASPPSAESAREGHREVPEYGRDEIQDREEGRSSRGGARQEPSTRDRDERGSSRRHETGQEGTFLSFGIFSQLDDTILFE